MQSILIIKEIRDVICEENSGECEKEEQQDDCLQDEEEELRNLS